MMQSRVFPFLLLAVIACAAPMPSVHVQPLTIIEANSWTRPYQWSRRQSRQLTVHVATAPANRALCDSLVDRALAAWSADGPVHMQRTSSDQTADVRIVWASSLPAQHPGVTLLKPNGRGELIGADVFVSAVIPARGDIPAERVLYGVIAHEIGHALGLPHTRAKDRIMNEVLHTLDITAADITSLRELRKPVT